MGLSQMVCGIPSVSETFPLGQITTSASQAGGFGTLGGLSGGKIGLSSGFTVESWVSSVLRFKPRHLVVYR